MLPEVTVIVTAPVTSAKPLRTATGHVPIMLGYVLISAQGHVPITRGYVPSMLGHVPVALEVTSLSC